MAAPAAATLRLVWALGVVAALALAAPAHAQAVPAVDSAPWTMVLSAGASVDRGGLNLGFGVHRQVSPAIILGLNAEYNPWFDILSGSVESGTVNVFASGAWQWLSFPGVKLRSSLGLGASVLLFGAEGPPAGAVGPYLSGSVLSAVLPLSRSWRMEIKPDLVLIIPQLHGTPLVYHEYRLTFGFEWGLPPER